ncbi:MAG: ferrous iron transport protein B [Chitinophagaceae bacterium]|nr:ferrous iron transport protein B [Chitinophagaceae bacterium]
MKKAIKNIALVGNPNSGKSSLFNALTGLNQRVGNFPGVTVDKKSGQLALSKDVQITLIDLPGTYSLYAKSDDEYVTYNVLFEQHQHLGVDAVVIVVDASNLKRNLLFCSQIMDLKKPVIVALTMMDIARQKGIQVDTAALSRELGVPVVAINPRNNKGITEIKKQLVALVQSALPVAYDFIDNLALAPETISAIQKIKPGFSSYATVQLASAYDKLPAISAEEKKQIGEILEFTQFKKTKVQAEEILARYARIGKIMQRCVVENDPLKRELFSRKVDEYILHPVWGNLFLLFILFVLFQSVYWIAAYPMNWIDMGMSTLIAQLKSILPTHTLTELLLNGVLAGISGILVFIPQIMILFGLITILEDSGYMSRISFLMDRMMRSVGLNGKSVMPLISAAACAVPAIMAARTIENKKEKLITILITPFMSCSARLPVYSVLIGLIIPDKKFLGFLSLQGLVMMGMYLLGFIMAIVASYVLNLIIKTTQRSIFLLELPVYRMPQWKNILTTMILKAKVFVVEAGKVILIISIVLWALSSYGPDPKKNTWFSSEVSLETSYAGILGKKIEPAIQPLGFDWKIGISLITSFAAREVFVGTMATLYSVDEEDPKTLMQKMASAKRADGTPSYTTRTGISLLMFYAFALQCVSTLATVKRETNSWKYPILQFFVMSLLAYLASFLVYNL